MNRVTILTPNSLEPLHPRTDMVRSVLSQGGHDVRLAGPGLRATSWLSRLVHRVTMGAFDFEAPFRYWQDMRSSDVVYACDMRLLFVLPAAKLLGKKVVYETLDNGPHLFFYGLCRHKPFFKSFPIVRFMLSTIERIVVRLFADATIVNSDALCDWFGGRAETLYYTSPLEDSREEYNSDAPPALLYLGLFSPDKGAEDMLALQQQHQVPLYVFGDVNEEMESCIDREGLFVERRVGSAELASKIHDVATKHSVVGLSLIRPVHYSYASQEANKDIDYMALGFPMIGNRRPPTAAKIEGGCGVFLDDDAGIEAVLNSASKRAEISSRARKYYDVRYAKTRFAGGLLEVVRRVLGNSQLMDQSANSQPSEDKAPVLASFSSPSAPEAKDNDQVRETT